MNAISENLANSATPGYLRNVVVTRQFDKELSERLSFASTDTSAGPLRTTDNPFDFAINGTGFFVVEKNGNLFLTRHGHFAPNADGTLVTTDGQTVSGEGGPIQVPRDVPFDSITVNGDGTIRSGQNTIGKLRIVSPGNPSGLRRTGTTTFAAPNDMKPPEEGVQVLNRTLEGSNTSVFEEMAEMTSASRSFEACQRMLKAMDQAESNLVRQTGTNG